MKKGDIVRLKKNKGKPIQGCEGIYILTDDVPANRNGTRALSYDVREGKIRSSGGWQLRCDGYYVLSSLERLAMVTNDQ